MMRATSIARTLSTRASALATTTTTATTTLISQTILSSRHVLYRSFASDRINLIVNAVGVDRPGIVSDIAQHVTDAGGNVGESQASRLGDYFSLMMVVSAPQSAEDLRVTLQQLPGLDVSVFDAPNPTGKATALSPVVGYSGVFTLEGADHPGIVHKVTSLLAKHNMNIEKLQTEEEIAPHGGTTLFVMHGIANVLEPLPKSFDPDRVRDELEELGDSLNCDIELEDNVDQSIQASFLGG